MPNRLTPKIIQRTNDQRRRLGRPFLSHAGFEHAIKNLHQELNSETTITAYLIDYVVPPEDIVAHTSAWEVPIASVKSPEGSETPAPDGAADQAAPDVQPE